MNSTTTAAAAVISTLRLLKPPMSSDYFESNLNDSKDDFNSHIQFTIKSEFLDTKSNISLWKSKILMERLSLSTPNLSSSIAPVPDTGPGHAAAPALSAGKDLNQLKWVSQLFKVKHSTVVALLDKKVSEFIKNSESYKSVELTLLNILNHFMEFETLVDNSDGLGTLLCESNEVISKMSEKFNEVWKDLKQLKEGEKEKEKFHLIMDKLSISNSCLFNVFSILHETKLDKRECFNRIRENRFYVNNKINEEYQNRISTFSEFQHLIKNLIQVLKNSKKSSTFENQKNDKKIKITKSTGEQRQKMILYNEVIKLSKSYFIKEEAHLQKAITNLYKCNANLIPPRKLEKIKKVLKTAELSYERIKAKLRRLLVLVEKSEEKSESKFITEKLSFYTEIIYSKYKRYSFLLHDLKSSVCLLNQNPPVTNTNFYNLIGMCIENKNRHSLLEKFEKTLQDLISILKASK